MYCSECGQKLDEGVKFCSNCGTVVSGHQSEKKESGTEGAAEPVLVLKPRIIGWEPAVAALPFGIFLSLWGGGIMTIFSDAFLRALPLSVPAWTPYFLIAVICILGIPVLAYLVKTKTYDKTEYRFFRNHLEYEEGFLTAVDKSLKYENVTKTAMRRGIVQKRYGLGTILLATPVAGIGTDSGSMGGIKIKDVENPEQVYKMVQKLVGC